MNRLYYSYGEFREDLKKLAQIIDEVKFDTIIAIARGGVTIGHLLSEYYNIRNLYTINSIAYNSTQKLESIEVFNIPNLNMSRNVLIVDDIVDSGDTLQIVLKTLKAKYPQINFYSASIFYKKTAKVAPTWYLKETQDWIDFFWSEDLK